MINTVQLIQDGGYVLAVEDSLVQARRLEFFFKENHIQYKLYTNAEEAYKAALVQKPELIVSDIIMPGMDGYEFCKKVKSTEALSQVPVILLTSLQDSHDIIKGLQAGADNFITKPYTNENLISRIQYLLISRDVRFAGSAEMVIEMTFHGEKYRINSDKKQILDLLLSVYEAAIQRNDELTAMKAELETANENLKQANQDLEAFSRTVSHDLKSPLNGIIGFADILKMQLANSEDEDTIDYINTIYDSARSMSNLIKDLLNFAKSGTVTIEQEPIDISNLADDVFQTLLKNTVDRKIEISIDDNLHAKADSKMIRVVFDNLIGNAIKYSAQKEVAKIVIGKKDYFGHDLFFIEDNGAGFDMAQAEKLFLPFQRLHSESEYNGTGVGLCTVKRIVEKHGGQIWAESEVGKGSTFFFTLEG
ncbi:MAG: response regulator [Bacteroidales bacterium]|nr:response regulator [Bacteroidales bacterium]